MNSSKYVKKRVLQIIDGWISGIPADIRSDIYQILIAHMQPSVDYVLRVYATLTLRNSYSSIYIHMYCTHRSAVIEDCDFEAEVFVPYLEGTVTAVMKLVEDTSEGYTCSQILSILTNLCTQVGARILPYVNQILQAMSVLWTRSDRSSEGSLLKSAVLRTLKKLTEVYPSLVNR
jgi:hypothetical protein